jgi:hypothetical protein
MIFKIVKAIRAYFLIQKLLTMKTFIFSIAIAFFSFFILEKASTQDFLAYLSRPIAEKPRIYENTYLQPDAIGCEGSASLIGLFDELENPVTGAQFKEFVLSLPTGQGVRAWLALKDTPLSSSVYWLGQVNKWQQAGLNFTFAFSMSDDVVQVQRNGIPIAELLRDAFKIKFNGFGGDIICPFDKTVTVIGLYERYENFLGLWHIDQLKISKFGDNPGGINMFSDQRWTRKLNREWLQAAIDRGDIIRITSDPDHPRTHWGNGIPPGQPGHNPLDRTVTSEEIDQLKSNGYEYDPSIPGYKKN